MKYRVQMLVQVGPQASVARNDKLPLGKLKVRKVNVPHPKNVESGMDPLGTTADIEGEIEADSAIHALGLLGNVIALVGKTDGIVEVAIDPK